MGSGGPTPILSRSAWKLIVTDAAKRHVAYGRAGRRRSLPMSSDQRNSLARGAHARTTHGLEIKRLLKSYACRKSTAQRAGQAAKHRLLHHGNPQPGCNRDQLSVLIDEVNAEIERRLRPLCADSERLMTIPGAGRRTAESLPSEAPPAQSRDNLRGAWPGRTSTNATAFPNA
jgi:hypothetical protein